MPRDNVSSEDLNAAVDWLENGYEGDDDTKARLLRVAEMLRGENAQRKTDVAIRRLMRETGASRPQARRALVRAMSA
jgi:hypothetical protein